ncbi:MAG: carboxypeptidase regulatory-like domain-containing protein [Candidatus Poribacteria bacterium]|nr:carboxypeptidase regulatory-like domain-containing protein [Candidatus Poribacteria bacterium]
MRRILTLLAFALLLFSGLNCGTENPIEETVDTTAIETTAPGSFYGDVELIDGVTIYMRFLKAGQILAQIEFETHGVKTTSTNANIHSSTQRGIGKYHVKEAEPGDYTVQISAKGYQTTELNVTVISDQSISLDKIALAVLETPVSHLRGVLTSEATGQPIGAVNLQLKDDTGKIYETLTTVTGVFSFENLPVQQPFTLTIVHAGYEDKEAAVDPIPAAETSELTVELVPRQEPERLDPGQGLSIGSQAPVFELPDSNNKLHALADYTADKNVVLIFYRGGW